MEGNKWLEAAANMEAEAEQLRAAAKIYSNNGSMAHPGPHEENAKYSCESQQQPAST